MSIDDHINRVEKYGFVRRHFPKSFNGHRLYILSNDAFIENDRLLFDFSLYCEHCEMESNISGRFPSHINRHTERVVSAKIATFEKFSEQCKRNGTNV